MKKLVKSGVCFMALAFLFISCSEEDVAIPVANGDQYQIDLTLSLQTDWQIANRVLFLINQHRTSLGLSEIVSDTQYASALAVEHTQYMIANNSLNHNNFDSREATLHSRGATMVGENVAKGYNTADEVVTAWLNSSSHRQVIEGNFTHAGFGILSNSSDVHYYTMLIYK
tara:strand:- start:8801 stop:9310 length:510 start_codon:yes stop_codon:yes gene_type:complete